MKKQRGLFDEDFRLKKISNQGDPLEVLNKLIDWEIFRRIISKVFKKEPKGPGGRPRFDYILMFKILILQRLYNLSDAGIEYQILDRLSFMRFLGLELKDTVPDEKTIWLFRETLTHANVMEKIFAKFNSFLENKGIIAQSGNIVDATFIEVPKQRNNREENKKIKKGETPEEWKEKPNKLRQKDLDARWMTKNGTRHYGYKNHIKVDRKSKMIKKYKVTDASVHDSQVLDGLLDKTDSHHDVFADSAYSGKPCKKILERLKIRDRIHEKGYRGHPLTDEQIEKNKKKSRIRARIEHVFGFMKNSMNIFKIRSIGIERVLNVIGFINLTYNICRFVQLQRA